MANLHTPDGKITKVFPINEDTFSLEELQSFVDGYMERIVLPVDKCSMIINEEGKKEKLPYNKFATQIFLKNYPKSEDYIVGNAIICANSDLD